MPGISQREKKNLANSGELANSLLIKLIHVHKEGRNYGKKQPSQKNMYTETTVSQQPKCTLYDPLD